MTKKVKLSEFRRTCKDVITIGSNVIFRNKKHRITGLNYSDLFGEIEIHLVEVKKMI